MNLFYIKGLLTKKRALQLALVIKNRMAALSKEEVNNHIVCAEYNDQAKNEIYPGQDAVNDRLFIALREFVSHDLLLRDVRNKIAYC